MQAKPCEDNEDGTTLNTLLADLAKVNNSRDRASKLFQWLINPIPSKGFFRYYYGTGIVSPIPTNWEYQLGIG